jgi:hypothetical protein
LNFFYHNKFFSFYKQQTHHGLSLQVDKRIFSFLQGCGSAFICHRIRIHHFRLYTNLDPKVEKNLRLKKKEKILDQNLQLRYP